MEKVDAAAVAGVLKMGENIVEQLPKVLELDKEDCIQLRSLWENVFYEDSKAFTDYYFKEKAGRNHAFAIEENSGAKQMDAMLYLSPYKMQMRIGMSFLETTIDYVVGVATRKERRHRGYMDTLLKTAFSYMYEKQRPFTFLTPANPDIYRPYQFSYIYDRTEYDAKPRKQWGEILELQKREIYAAQQQKSEIIIDQLQESDIAELAVFAEQWMEDGKDVFIKRNEEYFRTILLEMQAQDGTVYVLKNSNNSQIEGYFLYTEEEKPSIQEVAAVGERTKNFLFEKNGIMKTKVEKKPIIMARIIHVQTMLSMLRTADEEVMLTIEILDSLIPGNEGAWECYFGKAETRIERTSANVDCILEIDKMPSWIFGYASIEECFSFPRNGIESIENNDTKKNKNAEVLCKLKKVTRLEHVCINEII